MRPEAAISLVRDFGAAWDRCDVEAVLEMMAADVGYENVPLPPMNGRDEVRAFITPNMGAAERMDWKFLAVEADAAGRRVLTERVDSFIFEEGTVAVRLMGIFEIEDGKIARWRDYADIASFVGAMKAINRSTPVESTV